MLDSNATKRHLKFYNAQYISDFTIDENVILALMISFIATVLWAVLIVFLKICYTRRKIQNRLKKVGNAFDQMPVSIEYHDFELSRSNKQEDNGNSPTYKLNISRIGVMKSWVRSLNYDNNEISLSQQSLSYKTNSNTKINPKCKILVKRKRLHIKIKENPSEKSSALNERVHNNIFSPLTPKIQIQKF